LSIKFFPFFFSPTKDKRRRGLVHSGVICFGLGSAEPSFGILTKYIFYTPTTDVCGCTCVYETQNPNTHETYDGRKTRSVCYCQTSSSTTASYTHY
jgi:hypothetical protein